MSQELIKLRIEDEIAFVGFNRPEKRNAISAAVTERLAEVIDEVDNPSVRAIVLYGEGAVFSAGVDFTSLNSDTGSTRTEGGPDLPHFRRFVAESQAALTRMERIEKPVIGALHGYAGGLGLEIALACDARIAAQGTRLGMPE